MSEIPEKILERLKKLLRFAEDAKKRDSQAELENVMQKIQALTLEYNVELDSINLNEHKEEPIDQILFGDAKVIWPKNEGPWIEQMYSWLAKFFFVKTLLRTNKFLRTKELVFLGERHNIEIFKFSCDQLIPRIRSLGRQSWKEYVGHETNPKAYLRAFYSGCIHGLADKLGADLRKAEKGNSSNLPVLMNAKLARIDNYMKSNLKVRVVDGTGRALKSQGKHAGYEAGQKLNINKGLSTNMGGQNLLN